RPRCGQRWRRQRVDPDQSLPRWRRLQHWCCPVGQPSNSLAPARAGSGVVVDTPAARWMERPRRDLNTVNRRARERRKSSKRQAAQWLPAHKAAARADLLTSRIIPPLPAKPVTVTGPTPRPPGSARVADDRALEARTADRAVARDHPPRDARIIVAR